MKDEYKSTAHSKYLCQHHLVWCPKFRYSVLQGNVQSKLRHIFEDIAKRYGYEILEMEVMPDHIHPVRNRLPKATVIGTNGRFLTGFTCL